MVGDKIQALESIAAGEDLTIQPTEGEEWVVHNVYHEGAAALYIVRGEGSEAVECLIDSDTELGAWTGQFFHVTNTQYLKVKNNEVAAAVLGHDGVQTK